MASIIGYDTKKTDSGEARRAGMVILGQALIDNYSGLNKNVKGLRSALEKVVAFGDQIELRYVYVDSSTGTPAEKTLRIYTVKRLGKSDYIRCLLTEIGTPVPLKVGELLLQFVKDDGDRGDKFFFMKSAFPDDDDLGGFAYLRNGAEDIFHIAGLTANPALGVALGEAQKYLAAFTFLSRCK